MLRPRKYYVARSHAHPPERRNWEVWFIRRPLPQLQVDVVATGLSRARACYVARLSNRLYRRPSSRKEVGA